MTMHPQIAAGAADQPSELCIYKALLDVSELLEIIRRQSIVWPRDYKQRAK